MRDIKNPKAMWCKAAMFVAIAIVSSVLLLLQLPTPRVGILLAIAIWASCRAYYFAFYVIQHYVDPGFRFSGLWSFITYALRRRRRS